MQKVASCPVQDAPFAAPRESRHRADRERRLDDVAEVDAPTRGALQRQDGPRGAVAAHARG
eukprot:1529427-Prymnesium_polylepis.2